MPKHQFEKRFLNRFNFRINKIRSMLDGLEEVIDEFRTELDAREGSTSVGHEVQQHLQQRLRSENSSGRNSSATTDDLVEDDPVAGVPPGRSPFGSSD